MSYSAEDASCPSRTGALWTVGITPARSGPGTFPTIFSAVLRHGWNGSANLGDFFPLLRPPAGPRCCTFTSSPEALKRGAACLLIWTETVGAHHPRPTTGKRPTSKPQARAAGPGRLGFPPPMRGNRLPGPAGAGACGAPVPTPAGRRRGSALSPGQRLEPPRLGSRAQARLGASLVHPNRRAAGGSSVLIAHRPLPLAHSAISKHPAPRGTGGRAGRMTVSQRADQTGKGPRTIIRPTTIARRIQ